jgi:hypothetical protein
MIWLLAFLIAGASANQVRLWQDKTTNSLCVAVESQSKEATDVIVRAIYKTERILGDKPILLTLSRTITFPVYDGVTVMGDCILGVSLEEVERVEVRWLKEVP